MPNFGARRAARRAGGGPAPLSHPCHIYATLPHAIRRPALWRPARGPAARSAGAPVMRWAGSPFPAFPRPHRLAPPPPHLLLLSDSVFVTCLAPATGAVAAMPGQRAGRRRGAGHGRAGAAARAPAMALWAGSCPTPPISSSSSTLSSSHGRYAASLPHAIRRRPALWRPTRGPAARGAGAPALRCAGACDAPARVPPLPPPPPLPALRQHRRNRILHLFAMRWSAGRWVLCPCLSGRARRHQRIWHFV